MSGFKFDNTTGGTIFFTQNTGANISIGVAEDPLRNELAQAKAQLAEAVEKNKQLFHMAQSLEHEVKRLSGRPAAKPFTQKELKLLLSRMHPDKNDGKEIYNEITRKLLGLK